MYNVYVFILNVISRLVLCVNIFFSPKDATREMTVDDIRLQLFDLEKSDLKYVPIILTSTFMCINAFSNALKFFGQKVLGPKATTN
jgi:hypothetical protein